MGVGVVGWIPIAQFTFVNGLQPSPSRHPRTRRSLAPGRQVLLAEHKESKDIYAIKVLKKLTVLHDDDVEGMMAERKVLTFAAGCPFLCKLYASFQTDSRLYFVMDFINGGDLAFHRKRIASMAEEDVRFYIAEIVIALWFLHDQGIVYRDLKPVSKEWHAGAANSFRTVARIPVVGVRRCTLADPRGCVSRRRTCCCRPMATSKWPISAW